jgi:hypothetical protein
MAGNAVGGHFQAPGYETVLVALVVVALLAACVLIAISLGRHHPPPKPIANQWQALAVMGELCPHGWQAQITLYGWGAPVPADAPPSRVPPVELEWKQFDEEPRGVEAARRLWAPTIGEALQAMVDARRTDITFEQLERALAEADDAGCND